MFIRIIVKNSACFCRGKAAFSGTLEAFPNGRAGSLNQDDNDEHECCHHHHDEDDDDDDDDEHEHHHHHHHHHADEIFQSWGMETPKKFSEEELRAVLSKLDDEASFGAVLRAKGIVDASDGDWLYFDYVPGEIDLRRGAASVTGRFCVIGSKINESALKELFRLG